MDRMDRAAMIAAGYAHTGHPEPAQAGYDDAVRLERIDNNYAEAQKVVPLAPREAQSEPLKGKGKGAAAEPKNAS